MYYSRGEKGHLPPPSVIARRCFANFPSVLLPIPRPSPLVSVNIWTCDRARVRDEGDDVRLFARSSDSSIKVKPPLTDGH